MKRDSISRKTLTCSVVYAMVLLSLVTLAPQVSAEEALIMGIFPRRNASVTMKLFRPIAKYLAEHLGREVKVETSKDFKTFWRGVEDKRYDIVHYNQYHYILSNKFGYQVILKNNEFGESTIAGSIIVRSDSGINSVQDLKGKKVVFGGGPKAAQSYIVATYLLWQAGLKKGDYIEEFAKNPPNAIFTAYYKQSSAAGAGDKVLKLNVVKRQIDTQKMRYLIQGEQLPHLPWAVKDSMPPLLRKDIQTTLSQMSANKTGMAILKKAKLSGLEVAQDSEYDKHRIIINTVYPEEKL